MWFNTSVSLAAGPALHDSAFHHPKHVIAFDDNKRIVARELATVSENAEPPALQVQLTSAALVLGQEGVQTQRGPQRGKPQWACFSKSGFMHGALSTRQRHDGELK